MSVQLYHHPYTRAANVVWMLEEVGVDYDLVWVDIQKGDQKKAPLTGLNPMGKLPTLVDGDTVITESAAIALHLGDRYALGRLAPELTDPDRATYYRWILYSPSVIEPGAYAHTNDWPYKPGAAGWGTWEELLTTCEKAIGEGPWLLGERFTMADIVFGGTLGYMTMFKMMEMRPLFADYLGRIAERPAYVRQREINNRIASEHGL